MTKESGRKAVAQTSKGWTGWNADGAQNPSARRGEGKVEVGSSLPSRTFRRGERRRWGESREYCADRV